jgi:hypothetical protein
MPTVTSLTGYRNRHEKHLLRELLAMSERAPIRGLAICMITDKGQVLNCTGTFNRSADLRLIAALRLSKHLNEMEDHLGGR